MLQSACRPVGIALALGLACGPAHAAATTRFEPDVTLEQGYNDNVAFSGDPTESDTFTKLSLGLPVEKEWRTGGLRFEYRPSVLRYDEYDELDRDEHWLSFDVAKQGRQRSDLHLRASYYETQEQGNATSVDPSELFLSPRTDRRIARASLDFDRDFARRWRWGGSVGAATYDYEEIDDFPAATIEDRSDHGAALRLARRLARDASLGLGYQYSKFDLDVTGEEEAHALTVDYVRTLGRHLSLRSSVGAFRSTGDAAGPDDERSGVYASMSLVRSYRASRLSLQLRSGPSGGGSGEGTATDSVVALSLASTGTGPWGWSVSPRFALREPSVGSNNDQTTLAVSAHVQRRLVRKASLRLSGRWIDQAYDDPAEVDREALTAYLGLVWLPRGPARG